MSAPLASAVVGRSAELAALRTAFDGAVEGRGGALLLVGEPGVGKTRLLRQLRKWATDRGSATLVGRAVETATTTPFRALIEALLAAFRDGQTLLDPEVEPFRDTLARLVPGLGRSGADEPPPVLHVAEAFLRVARSRGHGQGTLVLLDDLHWADEETLAAFDYLADNVTDEAILLVAASRPGQDGDPPVALRRVADRRAAALVSVGRLTAEQVVEMTCCCLGDVVVPADVLQLVTDHAEGVPFVVEELLAGLVHEGVLVREGDRWVARAQPHRRPPRTFADSVHRRFAALPTDAADVLLDAALLGRVIDPDLLARAGERRPDDVEVGLDAGLAQGLLETAEAGVRFRHALTRDAVLDRLAPHERRTRSRRLLPAVRGARPELRGELVEVAAALAQSAGQPDVAAELYLEAGRRAVATGALTSAESFQRRALAASRGTPEQIDAQEALVATLSLAGRVEEVFTLGEVLVARLADAEFDPDGVRRRAGHLALARAAVAASDWALATAHLTQARCSAGVDPAEAVRVQILEAVVALGQHRLDDADLMASAAVAAAERAGAADLVCEALLARGRCHRARDLAAAAQAFQRARGTARAAGLAHLEARATLELGIVFAYGTGEDQLLVEARRLASATGSPETEAVACNALAVAAWQRADVDALCDHARTATTLARRYRLGLLLPAALVLAASAAALCGDRAGMESWLAEAEPLVRGQPAEQIFVHAHCRAVCALVRDELDVAAAELARAGEIALAVRPTALPPLVAMDVLLRTVRGADPGPLARAFRERHYDSYPQVDALLLVAAAVHAGRSGDGTAAAEALDRALRGLAPNPVLTALTARLVAPSALEVGWGDPVEWLPAALAVFDQRDLHAPAAACRALLARAADPRATASGSPDTFTPREQEVFDLVSEGLPNKEIAQRLYLSPRTVEKHVERLLAKTGSDNRAQLATYAWRRTSGTWPRT
jgi:DNA-binding NarL/FixJ family response regulator